MPSRARDICVPTGGTSRYNTLGSDIMLAAVAQSIDGGGLGVGDLLHSNLKTDSMTDSQGSSTDTFRQSATQASADSPTVLRIT